MAKRGTKTATPRLRFPEFRENDPWEAVKLESVLKFQVGFPFPSKGFVEERGGIRLIRNRDLRSNDKPIYYVAPYSAEFVVSDGDILVGMDGDFSPCVWDGGEALLNQRVGRVLPKADNDKRFLLYFLTAQLKMIEQSAARTTVKHLSHSDVEKICEPLPVPVEQKKIADCLTSLDEVIAAQGRKVEALKAHKRGLMQQLFPREGETRPRLRFPEFRGAPEWKRKLGGELFQNRKEGGCDGLPIYSVTVHDGMIPRASFDRDFYDIQDPEKNKMAHKGDIAYNMMRMWQGAQGVAVEDCMVSPAYVVLAPLEGVCSNFFGYLLKLPHSLELLTAHSRGLTKDRLRLYFDDFARMPLCVPGHDEQQRIADCLTSLDTRITTETNRLAVLKTHKQGLMQQLFPMFCEDPV
jgi:type I restriction enzyme S subunit